MKPKLLLASIAIAGAIVTAALAADVSKGALNGTTPGGISPKPMAIEKQRTYALQCAEASCYRTAASLQGDGGLAADCASDYVIAAGATREFDSAANAYLSVVTVADGGTAGCRLYLKTQNK
jgi:hypothetical protein